MITYCPAQPSKFARALLLTAAAMPAIAHADTWTWTGGASVPSWSIAGNWTHSGTSSSSPTPISSPDTSLFFTGPLGSTSTQNIASTLDLNSLTFNSSILAFTLGGSTLTFVNNSSAVAPFISQSSILPQSLSLGINLQNNLTLRGTGVGALNFNGILAGNGSLTAATADTVNLLALNTYSGGTILNSGILAINNHNALGTGALTTNGGELRSTANVTLTNPFNDNTSTPVTLAAAPGTTLTLASSTFSFAGNNALIFGNATDTGTINFQPSAGTFGNAARTIAVNGGTLVDGGGLLAAILPDFSITIAAGATLNLNDDNASLTNLAGTGTLLTGAGAATSIALGAANFSGAITGTGQIAIVGPVLLSGADTYTGATKFAGGSLGLANDAALSTTSITLSANTSLYAAGADHTLANPLLLNANKTLTLTDDPATGAHNLTLSGLISGAGNIVMNGSANVTLNATNTFTGSLAINSGAILLGNPFALQSAFVAINVDNGLNLNSLANVSVGLLQGARNLTLNATQLTLTAPSTSASYAGDLTGATGSLTVNAPGSTQTLTGHASSFDHLSIPNGTVTITNAANVLLNNTSEGIFVGGNGTVGTLQITAGASVTAPGNTLQVDGEFGTSLLIDHATLNAGFQTLIGNRFRGSAIFQNDATASAGSFFIVGVNQDAQGSLLVQTGATLVDQSGVIGLSTGSTGTAVIDGPTSSWVNTGALGIGGFASTLFGGAASLTIQNGASVTVGGTTTFWTPNSTLLINAATLTTSFLSSIGNVGSIVLIDPAGGTALAINGNADLGDYDGTISGSGSLLKSGTGMQFLDNANSYTGGTTVTGGTLITDNAHALGSGPLTVLGTAEVILQSSTNSVVKLPSLTLAGTPGHWSANVELNQTSLIIEATPLTKSATLATLQDQVAYGRSGTGGIFIGGLTLGAVLAVVDNAVTHFNTFDGQSVNANSILITLALPGDANLDNHVDLNDLNIVLNNLGTPTPAWTSGNFDNAPTIDLSDLNDVLNNLGTTLLSSSFSTQNSPFTIPSAPEPASLFLLALSRRS